MSYAENKADRQSVPEMVVMFAGAALSWSSKTQTCVTPSSAEAGVSFADYNKGGLFLEISLGFLSSELPKMRVKIL